MGQSQQELDIFAQRVLSGVSTTRKIGDAMASTTDEVTTVRRRWGTVLQWNNADQTIDARVDGIILPNLRTVSWYYATVGEVVMIEYAGNDPVCVGPVGYSAKNLFAVWNHIHTSDEIIYESGNSSLPPPAIAKYTTDNRDAFQGTYAPVSDGLADEVIVDMGANTGYQAPGSPQASNVFPDGKVLRIRAKAHSKERLFSIDATSEVNSWSLPTDISSPITVAKDTYALAVARYNLDMKKWMVESVKTGYPRPNVSRPTIQQRWTKGGIGTSISLGTGAAATAGQIVVLFHCNDYGYWGEMLAPSGTIPAANWTFMGGGGIDFACHTNCWVGTIPSSVSSFTATINQSYSFASSMFLYILNGARLPVASNFKKMTTDYLTGNGTYHGALLGSAADRNLIPPFSDGLLLCALAFDEKATFTNTYGGMAGAVTNAPPMSIDASDSNGTYHSGYSMNKYLDTPASAGDFVGVFISETNRRTAAGSIAVQGI